MSFVFDVCCAYLLVYYASVHCAGPLHVQMLFQVQEHRVLGNMNTGWDNRMCRHWQSGYCKFGNRCGFPHSQQPHHQTAASSSAFSSATASAAQAPNLSSSGAAASSTAAQPLSSSSTAQGKHRQPRPEARIWAHIFLFQGHSAFELVPRLIGIGGINTRTIYNATAAKVRIRGKGSGHQEVQNTTGIKMEARVPLMVAITCEKQSTHNFRKAVDMIVTLLKNTETSFQRFCTENQVSYHIASRPLFAFGAVSPGAEPLLRDLLWQFPHPQADWKKRVTLAHMSPGLHMNATAEPYDGPGHLQMSATAQPFKYNMHQGPGHSGTVVFQTHQSEWAWSAWACVDNGPWQGTLWTWPTQWHKSQSQGQETLEAAESLAQCHWWHDASWPWPTESMEDIEAMNQTMMHNQMYHKAQMEKQDFNASQAQMDEQDFNTYMNDVQKMMMGNFDSDSDTDASDDM